MGRDVAAQLVVRLAAHPDPNILGQSRRKVAADSIFEAFANTGWCGFLSVPGFVDVMPHLTDEIMRSDIAVGFRSTERLYDWLSGDLSSRGLLDVAKDELEIHIERISQQLSKNGISDQLMQIRLKASAEPLLTHLDEQITQWEEAEGARADYMQDEWKEQWYEERYELENGRFSDVDD